MANKLEERNDAVRTLGEELDQCPTSEILQALESSSIFKRARALGALARRSALDESLLDRVVSEITDPKNIDARLIGTVSVSHIGITCLLATDTAHAREAVRNLFCTWPEPDRSDLLWLLKSEGLSVDEVVSNGESQAPGPKQMRV